MKSNESRANAPARKKQGRRKYSAQRFAVELIVFLAVFLILAFFVLGISRVNGNSMNPTYESNQVVVYLRLGKHFQQGDVVALKLPSGERYIKRVIATEGDTVDLKQGAVYVNGSRLRESYAKGATHPEDARITYPYKVEKDTVFVLGDNRAHSVDSRTFGGILLKNVYGKIIK